MLELPQALFWYLWILIVCCFLGVYRVFATKPTVRSVRHRQFSGVFDLFVGFLLLALMLEWIK